MLVPVESIDTSEGRQEASRQITRNVRARARTAHGDGEYES
jgi:hypothetical protein